MPISRTTVSALRICIGMTIAGAAIGASYSGIVGGQLKIGGTVGLFIGAGVSALEVFVVQRRVGEPLRRMKLPYFIGIMTVLWMLIIVIGLQVTPHLYGMPEGLYSDEWTRTTLWQDLIFSLGVAFFLNFFGRIRSLVGSRVLFNFLLGRYHRPLREERVFLFLDLAHSTMLSEKLGDVRVQSLIGRFFFDIARPISDYGGETHRYIGDEIVVTWPLEEAIREACCIRCVFAIQDLIAARATAYSKEFGVIPEFRIGMHGGAVVASEVGDDKREIVYFGDTINTAARLEQMCKQSKRAFLVSGDLLSRMNLSSDILTEELGTMELRGKQQLVTVLSLSRAA